MSEMYLRQVETSSLHRSIPLDIGKCEKNMRYNEYWNELRRISLPVYTSSIRLGVRR